MQMQIKYICTTSLHLYFVPTAARHSLASKMTTNVVFFLGEVSRLNSIDGIKK
jgi:hypothetical protein